jgi:hypothetical protein
VYSTFLGDSGCSGVAVTPDGNAWITGGTSSDTFPTTPDAFQASHHASASTPSDAFVTELNSTGSSLLYSTYLGGSDTDFGSDLGLDSSGNAYVTGLTRSADFPTTAGALDRVFNGRQDIFWGDAFITKFAVSGTPAPSPSPSPSPSATVTLTVSATGRTGETVTSSPAGISVRVGSSAQASFAQGTSITLSVSNGRSAIWSGACSSGGSKTPSCTFTLNADASESVNVQ